MKKIIIALIFSNAISSFGQEGIMKKEADDKGNATLVATKGKCEFHHDFRRIFRVE